MDKDDIVLCLRKVIKQIHKFKNDNTSSIIVLRKTTIENVENIIKEIKPRTSNRTAGDVIREFEKEHGIKIIFEPKNDSKLNN